MVGERNSGMAQLDHRELGLNWNRTSQILKWPQRGCEAGTRPVEFWGKIDVSLRLHCLDVDQDVTKLTDAGKAAKAGIAVGDMVLSIDGISTDSMNHLEAQNKIKACTGNLNLTLQRAPSVLNTTTVAAKEESPELVKPVPIAHPHPVNSASFSSAPGTAYNKKARPFVGSGSNGAAVTSIPSASSAFTPATSAQSSPPHLPFTQARSGPSPTSYAKPAMGHTHHPAPPSPGGMSSSPSAPVPPHPSVYNTPINLYSNENACEVAMGQRRGLLESQSGVMNHNGVSRKHIVDKDIEFYHVPSHSNASKKRLMQDTEDWRPRTGTSQSRSFRILAQITGTENRESGRAPAARFRFRGLSVSTFLIHRARTCSLLE
ncbi:hypothetical protein Z043_107623 [Scleropages formosus]|uniref:PDZ domain-containing protein n=1 Tax=Scleropages formosus TaxID=113540 RepID=A0A0P7XDE9_SCLFO|nr:hypothetical protein Z043_107623 [Scleropages formosus]